MNERWIAPAFIVAIAGAVGFCAVYATDGNTQLQGLTLGIALLAMGTGMILWAKHFFPNEEVEQARHTIPSTPEEQQEFHDMIAEGGESVSRRKFLRRLALGGVGAIGLAAIFPLKSLGPNPGDALFRTEWAKGKRLTTQDNKPVKADALEYDGVLTVWPENAVRDEQSATLLVRVRESDLKPWPGRESWAPNGIVAYSKLCTHVGCPVGLYRAKTQELLCPCHQSTFKVTDGAKPVFGPAARPLPQLPIEIDSQGYLVAQSGYHEPVGAGFWNRGRKEAKS